VVGVAEDDVGAGGAHVGGFIALTVAAVPTGMKAGVRISPRCMAIVPVRAAPSVAEMVKRKRGIMTASPSRDSNPVDRAQACRRAVWRSPGEHKFLGVAGAAGAS
jgi:hypothetical protein